MSVERLTNLDIRSNNLLGQDCSVFSQMVNLKSLYIGNDNENKIKQNVYNRFVDSLAPLAKLTRLEDLNIDNTDIDSGLEYLSVRKLSCSTEERPESKVKRIEEQLDPYNGNFLVWKNAQLQIQLQRFQKKQFLFTEQTESIRNLEARVQELTEIIKKQKEKIINAFLRIFPEKNLLQELIKTHLEFIKFKKRELDFSGYDEKCEEYEDKCRKIRKRLKTKLEEKEMDVIRIILTECEELVNWELELEIKLSKKTLLIEKHRQSSILQITNGKKERKSIVKKRETIEREEATNQIQLQQLQEQQQQSLLIQLTCAKKKLEGKEEKISYLWERQIAPISSKSQANESLINRLINQLKEKPDLTQEKQKNIDQVKDFLGTKRILLNARQETVKGLQNCYNKFKNNRKQAEANGVSEVMTAMGGVANSVTFGIPKALIDIIKLINGSFKKKFSDKQTDKFKELLINDKENFSLISEGIIGKIHNPLIDIENGELRLFNAKYKIFEIGSTIWENKPFSTLEEMENAIILLNKNLDELRTELEQEEKRFRSLNY